MTDVLEIDSIISGNLKKNPYYYLLISRINEKAKPKRNY